MPSELQRLRKAAGYRNAADFAAEVGIAGPTYARYEREPEKIPTQNAWALADRFGVPIDVIVGREKPVEAPSTAQSQDSDPGDIQRAYDALSARSRTALDSFLGYLAHAEASAAEGSHFDEDRRFDAVARRYDAMLMAEMEREDGFADFAAFGSPAEMRGRFEAFVTGRAERKRAQAAQTDPGAEARDRQTISKIMQAYDRQHGTSGAETRSIPFGGTLEIRCNPAVMAEFDSSKPTGKEAIV